MEILSPVSVFLGWGIKWLWPLRNRTYKFFVDPSTGWWSFKKFLHSWNDIELRKIAAIHGDPDWIKNFYLKPHPIAIIETGGFLFCLFILLLFL